MRVLARLDLHHVIATDQRHLISIKQMGPNHLPTRGNIVKLWESLADRRLRKGIYMQNNNDWQCPLCDEFQISGQREFQGVT